MRVQIIADNPLVQAGLESVLRSETDVATVSVLAGRGGRWVPKQAAIADVLLVASDRWDLMEAANWNIPIMWSQFAADPTTAITAMRAAVAGITCLDCHIGGLGDGLRSIHRGFGYISPCMARMLMSFLRGGHSAHVLGKLGMTARELQILRLMADGAANVAIAEELKIEIRTVKHHASGIYRKLGAGSRAEAIALAYKLGLAA